MQTNDSTIALLESLYERVADEGHERGVGDELRAIESAIADIRNTPPPKDETCNGWSNYATWRVNLELCGDWLDSLSRDVEAGYREPFASRIALADELKETIEEHVCGNCETLAEQYALAFLNDVNYWEIADTFHTDYPSLFTDHD